MDSLLRNMAMGQQQGVTIKLSTSKITYTMIGCLGTKYLHTLTHNGNVNIQIQQNTIVYCVNAQSVLFTQFGTSPMSHYYHICTPINEA